MHLETEDLSEVPNMYRTYMNEFSGVDEGRYRINLSRMPALEGTAVASPFAFLRPSAVCFLATSQAPSVYGPDQ